MDISEFKEATFEQAKDFVLSKGLQSLKKDDDDFFCDILMSGCIDLNEKVELLLSAGINVNAPTDGILNGFTPLSTVVKKAKNPEELIDLLIANGAGIEAASQHGLTPLHCAVILQNLDLVNFLHSKGANPNAVDDRGYSCLMLALKANDKWHINHFYYAFNSMSDWLSGGPGMIQKPVSFEILDELVRSGAKIDYQAGSSNSVSDFAIGTGQIPVIEWLFRNGMKPSDTVSSNSSTTLLMSACMQGDLPLTKHLLQLGADVNGIDQDSKTALFHASDAKIAKILLDAGAELTHVDKNGRSLFQQHHVSEQIFRRFGKEFIKLGGDINGKNADGRNILHHLVDRYDYLPAIQLALRLGCDVNAPDRKGTTPLMLASAEYWQELLAAGARINDVDAEGNHALNIHLARELITFGADVNCANRQGQTPLMLAAQRGNVLLVKALLKAGASADAVDQKGKLATEYADVKALRALVEGGAPLNPESTSTLATAIFGKNASLAIKLLKAGLKTRLYDWQVRSHLALLENIAQENLDLFRSGIVGNDEKAEKLIAKIIAARDHSLATAKALPVCEDDDLPEALRPNVWPRRSESPTPHIQTAIPLNDSRIPLFNPPEGFEQRMKILHDQILAATLETSESGKKTLGKNILKICEKSRNGGLSNWVVRYPYRFDIETLLRCQNNVILQFWNDCFDIIPDLIHSYHIEISDKNKFDLIIYRLGGEAFQGIKQGHGFAIHCLTYFDSIELAPVMAREIGRMPAQIWLKRFSDTAIPGLLACAFSNVTSDRSEAQQALRWLATQGYKDRIKHSAKSFGAEAHATAETFLDRCDGADFLPKKRPKLPAYFVASAHPAPILKGIGKALPTHAVETLGRMMLASTCSLKTPSLINVIEACDPQSLADFAFSVYDSWVKNGARKEGIGFLHALAYLGGARASALLIRNYRNAPFYPATVAAIEALGALGTNAAISGLLTIMRFSQYDKAQAYAQEVLEGVAESRGLTTEQLEDLAIPDLGLNAAGQMHLDFGPRQFTASITASLDVVLTDNIGRLIKALPKAAKSDDARLAKLATAQWKEFKASHKTVSKDQLKRFEQAMVKARRWDGATFKEVITIHPLLSKMVRNLVWAVAGDDLNDVKSFRIGADGRYLSASEEVLTLADDASIILPHPLLLDDEISRWLEIFAREKLSQPILQLARKWFAQGTQTDELLDDKSGTKVSIGALKGLKSKGWWFDEGGAGMVWSVNKSSEGARASIDTEPGWSMSGFDYEDFGGNQTIKLDVSGDDAIAYSELVRELLSLPMVDE